MDAISGMGERLSYEIVAAALRARGLSARGVDARRVIVTDEAFGRARPLLDETAARARGGGPPAARRGDGARAPRLHRRHRAAA